MSEIRDRDEFILTVNRLMICAMEDIDCGRNAAGPTTLDLVQRIEDHDAALRLALAEAEKERGAQTEIARATLRAAEELGARLAEAEGVLREISTHLCLLIHMGYTTTCDSARAVGPCGPCVARAFLTAAKATSAPATPLRQLPQEAIDSARELDGVEIADQHGNCVHVSITGNVCDVCGATMPGSFDDGYQAPPINCGTFREITPAVAGATSAPVLPECGGRCVEAIDSRTPCPVCEKTLCSHAPLPPQRDMTADEAIAYCEVLDKAFGYPSSHALRRCEARDAGQRPMTADESEAYGDVLSVLFDETKKGTKP